MLDLTRLFGRDENAIEYGAGDQIFKMGDLGQEMYVVVEGQVDIIFDGKIIETINPGGLFGELSLIDASPRSADAAARGGCKIVSIDQRRFQFLVQQTPFFAIHVMRILAERLRRQTS
jgi:CRP-like cAMP-binding protein